MSETPRKVGRPPGPEVVTVTVRLRPFVRDLVDKEQKKRNHRSFREAMESLIERGAKS